MDIVVSINPKYLDAAESMLFSLRRCVNEPIVVWFLNHSVNGEATSRFSAYLKDECNIDLINIEIGASFFDTMPLVSEELFSIETYYRILIPWLLPEKVDRVLWLDADIIIRGDIAPFYHQDFEGHCIIACDDGLQVNPDAEISERNRRMFGAEHRYFNSGVMLMNTERIRQLYTLEDVYRIALQLRDRLIFPDQDITNYLFRNQVLYQDYRLYNCSQWSARRMSRAQYQSVRILHYYGPEKPWLVLKGSDVRFCYWRVQKQRGKPVVFRCAAQFLMRIPRKAYRVLVRMKHAIAK